MHLITVFTDDLSSSLTNMKQASLQNHLKWTQMNHITLNALGNDVIKEGEQDLEKSITE